MKPPSMLIRAFQVQIGREAALGLMRAAKHCVVSGSGVEPHVESVSHLLVVRCIVAKKLFGSNRLPRLDSANPYPRTDLLHQLDRTRMQVAGFLSEEERHGHAPLSLARKRPV